MPGRHVLGRRGDVLLALFAAAAVVADVAANAAVQPRSVALATGLTAAVALTWRRRQPLPVALIAGAAMAGASVLDVPLDEPVAPLLTVVIATYSVAAYAARGEAATGLCALIVADAIAVAAQDKGVGNFVFGLIWISAAWGAGRVAHARSAEARNLKSRAQQAAAEERKRIARELHDVISHSVTAMVVQAGAAEEVLRRDPDQALASVQIVQNTGRQALAELARLLGIMRDGEEAMGHAPMPGLTDLDELLATTRRAGQPVEYEVRGQPRPLPEGVELSLFRIVQESLTNVRKHASGASARVVLTYEDDEVVAEVTNGGGRPVGGARGSGRGLVGMRERVAIYGGTLEAEKRDAGGFGVCARLPLKAAE